MPSRAVTGSRFDLFRTATFRLAVGSSVILACVTLLQFALIYWRTTAYEVERADRLLDREAALMAAQSPQDLQEQMRLWATNDLRLMITAAGLFDAERRPIYGNLRQWPEALTVDGGIHEITVHPTDQGVRTIRAEALPVPGDRFLVLGRGLRDLEQLRAIVLAAIETCLIPALAFSLLAGVWLSRRALVRVGTMHRAIDRIMEGDLQERLPESGRGYDEMERLAASVNRMLDRLEHLLDEIKGVGDDIAHDLRTPLSRVRATLDRARRRPHTAEELQGVIDQAMADLDQSFSVITALLRIGEIENGRRRAAFAEVDLVGIGIDIVELYEPLAEARGIRLLLDVPEARTHEPERQKAAASLGGGVQAATLEAFTGSPALIIWGDRDLLIEVAANLVDNAIKFTPADGTVRLAVFEQAGVPVLRVIDDGIGVAPAERDAVLARFYRSDKSRHVAGSGLGLSLVSAIVRLHEARLVLGEGETGPGGRRGACFDVMFQSVSLRSSIATGAL